MSPACQPARRAFAAEIMAVEETYQIGESEKAPSFALLPTGCGANRLLIVGALTDIQNVGHSTDRYRARVSDPTGTMFVSAGQYEPECRDTLEDLAADTPTLVAVVAKPDTYETDGETRVSLRPESITEVTKSHQERWIDDTAQATIDRIESFDEAGNDAARRAESAYGAPDRDHYREMLTEALTSIDGVSLNGLDADGAATGAQDGSAPA